MKLLKDILKRKKTPPPALAGRKGDFGPPKKPKIPDKDRPSAESLIRARKGIAKPPPAKA